MTAPVRGQRPRYRARPEQAGPRTIAWFSRGAASAVMTKQAIETLPAVEVVCIALTTEHPDSSRFADDCERWFGQPITYIASDRFADTWDVWEKRRFLVGPHGAPCTGELKKAVRHRFARPDDVNLMGYTADETHRLERIRDAEIGVDFAAPLIDAHLTKADCLSIVEDAGIVLPEMYRLGYANNNCIGCVKGGMGYWNAVRVDFPEAFDRMAKVERDLSHAVNKADDGPVYLDELDPKRGDFNRDQPRQCSLFCPTDQPGGAP